MGKYTGTNDKALLTMCARTVTPPTTAQKYMDSAESCKAELSKSSNTSGTGIVNEDEGDTPVHVKKGEMDGGFENSKAVSSRDSIQYCMYSDKLGENLNIFEEEQRNFIECAYRHSETNLGCVTLLLFKKEYFAWRIKPSQRICCKVRRQVSCDFKRLWR